MVENAGRISRGSIFSNFNLEYVVEFDDQEYLAHLWDVHANVEDFLQTLNEERPYLYEEGKRFLRQTEVCHG